MLGHDVLRAGRAPGHELVCVDLPELDITRRRRPCDALLERARPDGGDRQLCRLDGRGRRRERIQMLPAP